MIFHLLQKNISQGASNRGKFLYLSLLVAAFIFLILSPLIQKGCFIDGMLYKTVAYNFATGSASFWDMKFTDKSMSYFCEQPPLYFYLLGNFYKAFGIHYLTDRFFTFVLFVLLLYTGFLITKAIFKKHYFSFFLLFVFFLLAIPVFCWSYVNQIIEPLLCVFVLLGILFFIKFVQSKKWKYVILFSLILVLLFLTKGFQSLFLITLPLSYTLLSRFKKKYTTATILSTVLLLGTVFTLLLLYLPAKTWYTCYYEARLVLTLNNIGNTTENHFEIIGRFFTEQIVCLGSLVLLLYLLKWKKAYPIKLALKNFCANKLAVSLLVCALAGSVPYAISLVQRGFYLIPAFVCFVLALIIGFQRYWLFTFTFLQKAATSRVFGAFVLLSCLTAIVFLGSTATKTKRNNELLQDLELLLPYLRQGEIVGIQSERWNDFSLHAYLYLSKEVSMSVEKKGQTFYILSKSQPQPDSLYKINLPTREIDLLMVRK